MRHRYQISSLVEQTEQDLLIAILIAVFIKILLESIL